MWNAYIRVDDVDAIYSEVQDRGAGIDCAIYNAPHGFREFGVQDPDGHDIAFGQRIAPAGRSSSATSYISTEVRAPRPLTGVIWFSAESA